MRKLFYEDPYLKEAEARVCRIDGNKVYFDQSIFYPEGGGQPGDRGTFNGYRILDTEKDGDDVAHIFESTEGLREGESGILSLDWGHRYAFMKRHSAQHLLSSIFFRKLGVGTLAVHLAEEHVTIELDRSSLDLAELMAVEDEASRLVRKALRIEQRDMIRSEAEALHMRRSIKVGDPAVKVVFIEGQDAVACGGVHVSSTAEIGEISYYDSEMIRGHLRTIWKIDDEAVRSRRENLEIVKEASRALSAPPSEISASLSARLSEIDELKREIRSLHSTLASMEAEKIESSSVHMTEFGLDEMRSILTRKDGIFDVLIIRRGEKREFLFLGSEEHFKELKNVLSLKGGGRGGVYQGSYTSEPDLLFSSAKGVIDGFKG